MPPGALDNDWSTLSGGEAQRVLVALAMAPRPQVLQLDESASALDLETNDARGTQCCLPVLQTTQNTTFPF
jgi:thiamine transport system ATP-binding protein